MEVGAWIIVLTIMLPVNILIALSARRERIRTESILNRIKWLKLQRYGR